MSKTKSKKDACYHKVKARYRVFPSAYAYGNKTKRGVGGAVTSTVRKARMF